MHIDEEQATVGPGQAILIPPGSWQSIRNTGTAGLKFLCIVHPAWRAGDEEVHSQKE
jgi:mannose-6-phosphate isomerase-like protein (cupin superfamily)